MKRSEASYYAAGSASIAYYAMSILKYFLQEFSTNGVEHLLLVIIFAPVFLIFLFPVALIYSYLLSFILVPIFTSASVKVSFFMYIAIGALTGGGSMIYLCWLSPHLVNLTNLSVGGILGVGAPFAFVGASAAVGAWYYLYRSEKPHISYES